VVRNILLDAIRLWVETPPYRDYPSERIGWQLLPAFEHGRLRVYYRDGAPVGLVTWMWLTRREFETNSYYGPMAFARDSGEVLYVANFIAPCGRSDVFYMARDLPRLLSELYPQARAAFFHRRDRVGSYALGGTDG